MEKIEKSERCYSYIKNIALETIRISHRKHLTINEEN